MDNENEKKFPAGQAIRVTPPPDNDDGNGGGSGHAGFEWASLPEMRALLRRVSRRRMKRLAAERRAKKGRQDGENGGNADKSE